MRLVENKTRSGFEEHRVFEPGDETPVEVFCYSWRGSEEGHWVRTDDGHVVQVLRAGRLKDGTKWIRTCTGTFRCLKSERLHTEPRQNRFTFNGESPVYHAVTKSVETFAQLTARGIPLVEAYQSAFPRASREHAAKRGRWLLQRREVREIVSREIGDLMDQLGITESFILENFKEVATDEDNQNARISALKELANMRGMIKKVATTQTMKFRGIPSERLGAAQAALGEGYDGQANVPLPPVPMPSQVDFESIEASYEVTTEAKGEEVENQ